MVGHGGSSAGSYLADPTSPIPSHCASIVVTGTLRVKDLLQHKKVMDNIFYPLCLPGFSSNAYYLCWYPVAKDVTNSTACQTHIKDLLQHKKVLDNIFYYIMHYHLHVSLDCHHIHIV